nr:retrovirus-related Pol polyprotein from transposon TNT 1-94 [Tanacetum cinerariifolium]
MLIACQIVDNGKKRLGYEHYNAVPPPYIGNFKPPTPDLSLTGLDEFVNKPVVENSNAKEETKSVRKNDDALIIKEWVSDNEEENVSQPRIEMKTVRLSIVNKEIVKPRQQEKTARKTVKQVENHRQNTHRPRGIQRNWINMMSQKLGSNFKMFNYEEIDRGYVVFGGNPKGEKITGKARTPQQNRVAERRNMTLIEAARTMLADSKLPTTFWAESVNTVRYVQNRGKVDEGFFVGYSLNSKAFRVFNSKTRIVEENLHIRFSESTPNVVGSELDWLFDIDAQIRTINYEAIVAGTQFNGFAVMMERRLMKIQEKNKCKDQEKEDNVNSTNNVNTVSSSVNAAGTNKDNELPFDSNKPDLEDVSIFNFLNDDEDDGPVADINKMMVQAIGTKLVFRNKKDERGIVIRNKARLVAQGHTQEEGIDYDKVFAPVVRIEAIRLFLAYALFKDFVVYQMDVKSDFLYGKIEEEVYVRQPQEFEDLDIPDRVYKVEKALYGLHQSPRAWYLKGRPKLGLWYPKDSPLDLVAYTDSDYAGASLDQKSTTGGIINIVIIVKIAMACVFLVFRLTFCKKRHTLTTASSKLMLLGITYYCQLKVNADRHNLLLLDGKKIIITEASIRRDLQLVDEEGVNCLTNSTISEQLALMGPKTTAWNEFSSTAASAIICLATNQKFNFSKWIFDSMIRNLDNVSGKFLMYPRKGFSRRVTPLFPTIVVQSELGEDNVTDEAVYKELGDSLVRVATTASSLEGKQDSGNISNTQSKATPNEPSSQGTDSGGGPRCQEAMGDTTAQTRFESVSEHSNNSLLARGNTLQSDEDRMKLNELMELCTNLQTRVLKLEKTKTTQGNEMASLKKRVKKLKNKYRSRTHKLKRLYKIGLTARVESSDEESLGEDASKQERIEAIDQDEDITLVNDQDDAYMFNVNDLGGTDSGGHPMYQEAMEDTTAQTRFKSVSKHSNDSLLARGGEEVFVAEQEVAKDVKENMVEEVVNAAQDNTATTITTKELTLAQALEALKTSKPKVKGIFIQEQEEPGKSTTTTSTISKQQSHDKGKGIMIKEPVMLKKKDQIRLDEEASLRLQAEFDEEERLARERERAEKEQEANITLIESWDDIQARLMMIINWLKDCKYKNKKSCLMLKRLNYLYNPWTKEESTLPQKEQKRKGTNHQHKLKKER